MAGLIDSSVIIELERSGLPPEAVAAIFPGEPVALAAITASELLVGVLRANTSQCRYQRMRFVEAILNRIAVFPFDLPVARHHAQIGIALRAAGRPIGSNDLLIAATALSHGRVVITHNVREFAHVPGLAVRLPDW